MVSVGCLYCRVGEDRTMLSNHPRLPLLKQVLLWSSMGIGILWLSARMLYPPHAVSAGRPSGFYLTGAYR